MTTPERSLFEELVSPGGGRGRGRHGQEDAALGSGGLRAVSRARAVAHARGMARQAAARAAARNRKESLELELSWVGTTPADNARARHVIDTCFEPSFIGSNGIL